MSLTLNDEQEKALRNWYRQWDDPTEPECRHKNLRLYEAIRPLMVAWGEPFRHSTHEVSIDGPCHRIRVIGYGPMETDPADLARKLRDFLNKLEARK